jgi:KDO2-lipid IV(A) lauroyltransferase
MLKRHIRRVVGPEVDETKIAALAEQAFDSYARYWIDSARLQGATPAEVDMGFTVEGFEHIEDAFSRGVGPILALPHLGGWEWAGRWLTCRPGYEVTVVVEAIEPPELFTWMADYRKSFGMNVVPLGPKVAGEIIAALKANHVVCLLSDRDLVGGGVPVDFFGEQTTLPGGPATVAFRTGAAIIPVGVYQQPGRHHAICRPPLQNNREGKLRSDVARVTQALAHELEWLISRAPQQWHLLQPNWPSDHEFLASESTAS